MESTATQSPVRWFERSTCFDRSILTIRNGPRRGLKQEHLQLDYIGTAARPYGPRDIRGNRFTIVVRDLTETHRDRIAQAVAQLDRGIPNYFDDQRFGSLGESGQWIGEPWCKGDYERTLWLALADANEHDRPDVRKRKQQLRDAWRDWDRLFQELDRSHERSIVTYLCDHPTDFRGALARVRQDLRSIYVAAFQSMLWNRMFGARNRTADDARSAALDDSKARCVTGADESRR